MKKKTTITEISHNDIVTLLADAIYGSAFFGLSYDRKEYMAMGSSDEYEYIEDKCAKMLLGGKAITVWDCYAENETDAYGNLEHSWDSEAETMDYTLTLEDLKTGFQRCIDGTFEVNNGCEEERAYIRKCMADLMDEEGGDLDQSEAENILQVIVFGKIIYG